MKPSTKLAIGTALVVVGNVSASVYLDCRWPYEGIQFWYGIEEVDEDEVDESNSVPDTDSIDDTLVEK